MDPICWIPILIVAYIAIKSIYETWQTDDRREETGRASKNEFRVDILGKKTYKGWITISDRLKIFGWWGDNFIFGIFGLSESFSEEVGFGEIIKFGVDKDNTAFQATDLLKLEIEKYSRQQTIYLRVKNSADRNLIIESISEHIVEYKRKVEVESTLRARYKTGNFKDINPYDFEKVVGELFTFMGIRLPESVGVATEV